MEPVNIYIATQSRYAKVFTFLAKLFGASYSIEKTGQQQSLQSVIEKGKKDFAEGKGTIMTIDELRALTNEAA